MFNASPYAASQNSPNSSRKSATARNSNTSLPNSTPSWTRRRSQQQVAQRIESAEQIDAECVRAVELNVPPQGELVS
jgi:hypothetical protein